MSWRPNHLNQKLNIGGSHSQGQAKNKADEPMFYGQAVSGQAGSSASITALIGDQLTITGLTGMVSSSVGRFLTIIGSASNNGTFRILELVSSTSVVIFSDSESASDANNGSISWVEREAYTLEDDINFIRTDRAEIKGVDFWEDVPNYVRPTDTLVDVPVNLSNIAGKTLDSLSWLEPRFFENITVSTLDTSIIIVDSGNLKHASSTDITGIPIFDGYDSGNVLSTYVHIADANLDGYSDGSNLFVQSGAAAGELIFGITMEGASSSPNSIEVIFYSKPITDWSFSNISPYTWESTQINNINLIYSYRQRLDLFNEAAIKSAYITNPSLSGVGGGSGTNLPTPSQECQVLYALNNSEFTPQLPLTSDGGWLVNDDGCLLVVG